MYWLDFAIVYLALGAPFGVFKITEKREMSVSALLAVASSYFLWPFFALHGFVAFVFSKPTAQKDELESIRVELEKAVMSRGGINELFAFREVFYRYTGLAQASNDAPLALKTNDLLMLAQNENRNLWEACAFRRDRQKLSAHLDRARVEFLNTLSLSATKSNGHLNEMADALAQYLADTDLADAIHSR